MNEKRSKMLTVWVSPAEHETLLARCDRARLATWMRETCLGAEKRRPRGNAPDVAPALLRQLAGAGNNLNQVARQVNAAVSHGEPLSAVKILSQLAAIERELKALRQEHTGDR
ncbi:MobC family plasmid mobilization relaxosome protein [Erwinia sp.]|uniref:MobC family plasmid mobilization relaxosome protein n=1 Tax=Erwinia citreus TaxID=558 RepID=UPI003C7113BF